jgi:hypothetical protein
MAQWKLQALHPKKVGARNVAGIALYTLFNGIIKVEG